MEGLVSVSGPGIACWSVCVPSDWPIDKIEEVANFNHPTGISSNWRISSDEKFSSGHTNPCPCEKQAGRTHWLLNC